MLEAVSLSALRSPWVNVVLSSRVRAEISVAMINLNASQQLNEEKGKGVRISPFFDHTMIRGKTTLDKVSTLDSQRL